MSEIIVTGTLRAKAPVSVSVSTLSTETLEQTTPISAADLLRNVPGVFVNSALGEVRNVVYSRGISANSTEASSGYYYVSLQEDGLPVTNTTFTNYSPDFFYRQDLSLSRLEALRGGTAVVTGPNAPGGIFNYITKTGRSDPGMEARTRLGLEGNGRNPYYRGDIYAGGQIGQNDLYYSVSGFYRYSTGARDPGYAMNRGGQVKGNLLWDYGDGTIMLYGKYLDDRNAFNEFLPAQNFDNPKLATGISRYDSLLIPSASHSFVETANGGVKNWDGSNLVHSTSKVAGFKIDHDFGGGWTFNNNFKYSVNKAHYNTSALTFVVPITDGFANILLNANASGTYTYTNHNTGALLAQVQNVDGVRTVTTNNLPNQQVLSNGIVTQTAFNFNPDVTEVMDQFGVSKKFDRGSITLGGFYSSARISQSGGGSGFGISTIENQPSMIDITLTTADGTVKQITDAAGFAGIGQRFLGNPFKAKQQQISIFGGFDYELTDKLIAEGALRYEHIRNSGSNTVQVANPLSSDPTYGGLDGNANTLYDNYAATYTTPYQYRFNLDFISFSGALTYELDNRNSIYARYSQGKKAPDVGFYLTYDTVAELDNLKPIPQKIQQIEAGYKYRGDRLRVVATPFYSKLSNVGTSQFGTRADGSTYVPPVLLSTTTTYGLELEADVDVVSTLNLRTALTLQNSKSKDFAIYVFGAPGEADDTISAVPNGDADNAAKIMATTTLRFTPSEKFTTFLTWRHLGKRAANRYNAFYLPAYNEVDFGATLHVGENFTLGVNVNNLMNETGILSFAPAGTVLGALDRQALTPASIAANPNQLFSVLENQPRSYFLTAGVKF